MDDELQAFEAELRELRPSQPSRALRDRIARDLMAGGPASKYNLVHLWWSVVLPAAAALAIVLTQYARRSEPALGSGPLAQLKPVAAENVLYAATDEGIVVLDDGTPARRERLQFVDTIKWRDPRTHASLTWTVPREEVRVVPVSYQ